MDNRGYKISIDEPQFKYGDIQKTEKISLGSNAKNILEATFNDKFKLLMSGGTSEDSIWIFNEQTRGVIKCLIRNFNILIYSNIASDTVILTRLRNKIHKLNAE